MRIPRVLLPEVDPESGAIWQLDRDKRHYLINVLRLKPGRELIVFDGLNERESRAQLISADKKSAEISLLETYATHRESPLQISLCLGISKGDHMDFGIQKAVELGVKTIQPVFCERSALKPNDSKLDKKITHWDGIITSACEQSGRCIKPTLMQPIDLAESLDKSSAGIGLILMPSAQHNISDLPIGEQMEVSVFIGPEGGFSGEEEALANESGLHSVLLGPRVLRTETAVIASLTALQLLHGDLGNR